MPNVRSVPMKNSSAADPKGCEVGAAAPQAPVEGPVVGTDWLSSVGMGAAAPASVDMSAAVPGGGGTSAVPGGGGPNSVVETASWSICTDKWSTPLASIETVGAISADPLAPIETVGAIAADPLTPLAPIDTVGAIAADPLAAGFGAIAASPFGGTAAGPLGGGGGMSDEIRLADGGSIARAPGSAAPLVPGTPLRLRPGLSVRGLRRNTYAHTHTRSAYVVDL